MALLHFRFFAVAITLSINSIWSATAKLSQEQFEGLIGQIPNEDVRFQAELLYAEKQYKGLTNVMIGYLDEYLDEKHTDDEAEIANKKKGVIMGAVLDFMEEKREERAGEAVVFLERINDISNDEVKEQALNLLGNEKFEELEDMLSATEESEAESKGSQVSIEKVDLFDIIDLIPDEKVKEEALNLLADKKYDDLEDMLVEFVDEYISSLPEDKRDTLESHKVEIKQAIDKAVASMEEEAFEDSEIDFEESEEYKNSEEMNLFDIIDGIPNNEVQEKALYLLEEKKYEEVEDMLVKYADEYLAALPDNKKSGLESHNDLIKQKIKRGINKAVASMKEESFEVSEDKEESIDSQSDAEEAVAEKVLKEIAEQEEAIADLLSKLGDKN